MSTVILITTAHGECGNCNSDELLKIIEQIKPDVIFEEIPTNKFNAIYNEENLLDSLETKTVKRYLQNQRASHIPVDLVVDERVESQLKSNMQKAFDTFDQYPEIRRLNTKLRKSQEQFGFEYLNSEECEKLFSQIHLLQKEILSLFDDSEFSDTYELWCDILNKREETMINNIYNYSSEKYYSTAVFLVGVEHRKPIIEKIQRFETKSKTKLTWDFNYFRNNQTEIAR